MKKFVEVSEHLIGKTITGMYVDSDRLIMSFDNDEYISLESQYDRTDFIESELNDDELSWGVTAGVLTEREVEEIKEQKRLEREEVERKYLQAQERRELQELARLQAKYPENLAKLQAQYKVKDE